MFASVADWLPKEMKTVGLTVAGKFYSRLVRLDDEPYCETLTYMQNCKLPSLPKP